MNVPETFFSVEEELWLFLLSCIAGAVFGVYYDFFRTLRLAVHHHSFFIVIEDVVFLGTYAVFLSAFASAAARGELRAYYVFGGILGFTLYYFTVGKFVIRLMQKITGAIKWVFAIAVKPFKAAACKFVGNAQSIVKINKNSSDHLKNKRHL